MITLDTTPPEDLEIIINNNAKYTNSQIIDLKLSAEDSLSGLEQMSFSFDGSTWTTWEQFGTSKLLILPGFEGQHNVYLQVKDLAGNTANSYESIILDTTSPSSLLIEINNHDTETASTTVTLTLNAVDELSGISMMAFSVDKVSWSSWETFSNSKSFELSTGDGTKFVYFIVKDYADNVAEPTFGSIYLNTKPQVGDSDEDGYNNDVDAFPNDPAASLDSDSDGSPDHWNTGKSEVDSITYLHLDAFPDDPAASIDSDGDNYPDRWNPGKSRFDSETGLILDAYPDNPDKHQKDAQKKTIETEFMFVILIIIVLALLVVLIASFVHRNKSQRQLRENVEDKILKKLRYEILNDEIPGDPELTDADLINRLELDYSHGEISDETYQYIKNRIMNEKI
jgi:uncharacterized membrane protein